MIILLHPRTTRPKNRRFPLSVLSLAAVLDGREDYAIVDGNVDPDPMATLDEIMAERPAEILGVSVMPGPQMVAAIGLCRRFRERYPQVPIVWGGYFPSLYADAALNAPYVDVAVRAQGEDTILELLEALRRAGSFRPQDLANIDGISYKDPFGLVINTRDRVIRSPGDFPFLPYHRLRDADKYIVPTFLGKRTAVHHASYGCPFRCNFCGVTGVAGGRQKSEAPARTADVLTRLQRDYAINAVQFYDNNFFLREADTAELAALLTPLRLKWWCEGRIDTLLRYSDETLRALRRSGCEMIFLGAESGNDEHLRAMQKQLTSAQILEIASRIRKFGITPEFSFVIGNPRQPDKDFNDAAQFIRRIKRLNPAAEIVVQHYIPTPHPDGMYGDIEQQFAFPKTPDEWASPRWYNFTVREDPALPWLPPNTKRRIDGFETVMECRWPTAQDITTPRWARAAMKGLAAWRYSLEMYDSPAELKLAQKLLKPRRPKVESV